MAVNIALEAVNIAMKIDMFLKDLQEVIGMAI
jgi:hypothetical protein